MHEKAEIKILLAVEDQRRKARYVERLVELGAVCSVVVTLQEAITHASEEYLNGVLIDMPLIIRTSDAVKAGVEDLMSGLPGASLNIHGSTGDIRVLPRGAKAATCSSLERFVRFCSEFQPKIIFNRQRKRIHFNVQIDTDQKFAAPEKTVCMDISVGGCFVFCVREDITVGSTVWMKLPDSVCDCPVKGVVCWVRKWGISQDIPGIGLRFEVISDELKRIFRELK